MIGDQKTIFNNYKYILGNTIKIKLDSVLKFSILYLKGSKAFFALTRFDAGHHSERIKRPPCHVSYLFCHLLDKIIYVCPFSLHWLLKRKVTIPFLIVSTATMFKWKFYFKGQLSFKNIISSISQHCLCLTELLFFRLCQTLVFSH